LGRALLWLAPLMQAIPPPPADLRPKLTGKSRWDLRVTVAEESAENSSNNVRASLGSPSGHVGGVPFGDCVSHAFSRGGLSPSCCQSVGCFPALNGDGKLGSDELDVAAAKLNIRSHTKVWVMGQIGTDLLDKIDSVPSSPTAVAGATSASPKVSRAASGPTEQCRLECQSAGWMNGGDACSCDYYDPHLLLPLTSFSKIEMARDIQVAARQMLNECDIKDENNRAVRGQDFVVVIEDLPRPSNAPGSPKKRMPGMPYAGNDGLPTLGGSTLCCRMKRGQHLRSSVAEADESGIVTRESLSKARLSSTEYIANQILLPQLHKFCDQYRAVKLARTLDADRDEAEKRKKQPWKAKGRKIDTLGRPGSPQAETGLNRVSPPSPNVKSPTNYATPPHLDQPADNAHSLADILERPHILCRCGHAELWHRRPSNPIQLKGSEAGARGPPPSLRVSVPWKGRALPTDNGNKAGSVSLNGGKLVFSQAGSATLQSSASAPGLGMQ